MDTSSLMPIYQALERGEWAQADALFQQLAKQRDKRVQSQGYAGLAALALARRDSQQALAFAGQAEALDPEIAYTHVIRGDLLLQQGKVAEATSEYRTATEKAHGAPWQQAIADNHLGRIYAVQGDVPKALEHYDRAISRDQQLAVAYANKGHLLEKIGKPQEALGLYRQALQLNPDDRLTADVATRDGTAAETRSGQGEARTHRPARVGIGPVLSRGEKAGKPRRWLDVHALDIGPPRCPDAGHPAFQSGRGGIPISPNSGRIEGQRADCHR